MWVSLLPFPAAESGASIFSLFSFITDIILFEAILIGGSHEVVYVLIF